MKDRISDDERTFQWRTETVGPEEKIGGGGRGGTLGERAENLRCGFSLRGLRTLLAGERTEVQTEDRQCPDSESRMGFHPNRCVDGFFPSLFIVKKSNNVFKRCSGRTGIEPT